MRNNYFISLFLLLTLTLWSCFEDKGNYEYSHIDDITIKINSGYSIPLGDMLTITPEIKLKGGSTDMSALQYKWTVNGETREGWDKQVFEWKTDKNIVTGTVVLEVTDTRSGIRFYGSTSLSVNGTYNLEDGWMILSEKNNESVISILKVTDSKWDEAWEHLLINKAEIIKDVYKKENKVAAGTGPLKLVEHYKKDNNYVGPFLLLQTGGDPIDINGETMLKDINFGEAFAAGVIPAGETIVDACFKENTDVLIGKTGKLYSRIKTDNSLFNSGKYLDEPLKLDGEVLEGCVAIPSAVSSWMTNINLIHDTKKKRLLLVRDSDSAIIPLQASTEDPPQKFVPLNDLSGCTIFGFDWIKDGWYFKNDFTMILKKENVYYYQTFRVDGSGGISKAQINKINGLTEDPTCISSAPANNYIFIAVKNKLYCFDPGNPDVPLMPYLEFDSDIVSIDANHYSGGILSLKNNKIYLFDSFEAKNIPLEKRIMYSFTDDQGIGNIIQVKRKKQTRD